MTIVANKLTKSANQFYFLSEDSSNTSSLLSRSLSSFPQWPEGATGFSIDSLAAGTNNGQSTSLVTGVDIRTPANAGNVAVGPFLRQDVSFFGSTTKTFKWEGAAANSEIQPSSDGKTEVPLQFSGNANDGGGAPQYLFDFGLAQWDESSSTVTEVNIVEKNADNPDIIFKVKVFNETDGNVIASSEAFGVTFSGRWHF